MGCARGGFCFPMLSKQEIGEFGRKTVGSLSPHRIDQNYTDMNSKSAPSESSQPAPRRPLRSSDRSVFENRPHKFNALFDRWYPFQLKFMKRAQKIFEIFQLSTQFACRTSTQAGRLTRFIKNHLMSLRYRDDQSGYRKKTLTRDLQKPTSATIKYSER